MESASDNSHKNELMYLHVCLRFISIFHGTLFSAIGQLQGYEMAFM